MSVKINRTVEVVIEVGQKLMTFKRQGTQVIVSITGPGERRMFANEHITVSYAELHAALKAVEETTEQGGNSNG